MEPFPSSEQMIVPSQRNRKKYLMFYKIPGGMPGIEVRLSIMYSEGVLKTGSVQSNWLK